MRAVSDVAAYRLLARVRCASRRRVVEGAVCSECAAHGATHSADRGADGWDVSEREPTGSKMGPEPIRDSRKRSSGSLWIHGGSSGPVTDPTQKHAASVTIGSIQQL